MNYLNHGRNTQGQDTDLIQLQDSILYPDRYLVMAKFL